MKQAKFIITLGSLVVLIPFLGFPTAWKQAIFAFLGLMIIMSAYRLVVALRPGVSADEITDEITEVADPTDETQLVTAQEQEADEHELPIEESYDDATPEESTHDDEGDTRT